MKKIWENDIISGYCTPGTGKTRLGRILAVKLSLKYINIGDFARENECFIEYDSDLDCHIIDEKLMASKMKKVLDTCDKGIIIDHHDCEIFPKDMFKYIFCLTTSNEVLYDRLVESIHQVTNIINVD
ncbi:hypothetical protein A3Q56_01359 [Intoshia linei]|uniref:Uncharacterized protein n=1 Tax=Intoshia linei TaxID=1819745 RepID=A0A177B9A4_9BILA|nr:hypothetical protein A3Q56_01359 [Intoshia linei]